MLRFGGMNSGYVAEVGWGRGNGVRLKIGCPGSGEGEVHIVKGWIMGSLQVCNRVFDLKS